MRIDLYTKTVMTVIAAALLYLCVALTPIGTPVQAQPGVQRVVIAGWEFNQKTVPLSNKTGMPVYIHGTAPTSAESTGAPIPVPPVSSSSSTSTPRALAAPRAAAPATATRIQCQATTKKGSQCSRMANAGARYCWQHGGE